MARHFSAGVKAFSFKGARETGDRTIRVDGPPTVSAARYADLVLKTSLHPQR